MATSFRAIAFVGIVGGAIVWAACSGDAGQATSADEADGGASSSGGSSSSSGGSSSSSGGSTSSSGGSTSSSGGSSTSSSSGSSGDAGDAGDAGEDAGDAGGDAGPTCPAGGVCTPTTTRNITCGSFCGTYVETCSASCQWQQTTNCVATATCVAGEVDETNVGCAGDSVMTRTCSASCGWGTWSACGARPTGWVHVPDHGRGYNKYQQVVWTGSEMFVLGGANPIAAHSKFVGAYSPSATTWRTPAQLPAGRTLSFAAWTGSQILVWGGYDAFGAASSDGYVYDVAGDTWTKMSASPLTPRTDPIGVWVPATSELVVWGGDGNADGAAYSPATDTWRTIAAATIGGRSAASAVLAGGKVVIFGGNSGGAQSGDAGVYDAAADAWTSFGVPMSWQREYGQGATASVDTAYFWGGLPPASSARGVSWSGGTWSLLASPSALTLPDSDYRQGFGFFFANAKLWVWGGLNETALGDLKTTATGASLDIATSTWTAMPTAPFGIEQPVTTVWTGREAIFWGERAADEGFPSGVGGLLYRP